MKSLFIIIFSPRSSCLVKARAMTRAPEQSFRKEPLARSSAGAGRVSIMTPPSRDNRQQCGSAQKDPNLSRAKASSYPADGHAPPTAFRALTYVTNVKNFVPVRGSEEAGWFHRRNEDELPPGLCRPRGL